MDLSKHCALVTGGGRGIGAATAEALANAGADVVVSARSQPEIEAVAERLRHRGTRSTAIPCDLTDPAEIERLQQQAATWAGSPIDILVNNAGWADSRPLRDETPEHWDGLFAINVRAVMLCAQSFLPEMLETGWGRIVNVASIAGKMGAPYISAYSSSKHAVIGLTRSLAAEVATRGVTVNAVCPGYVETEMTRQSIERIMAKTGISREQAMTHLSNESPQGRIYQPEEVAYAVVMLCHDLAGGINGQSLVIDGGKVQA